MGGSKSKPVTPTTSSRKRVVIIGGSFGGKILTQALQAIDTTKSQFEITIVDRMPHFEFIPSNFKTLCDDGEFDKNAISFQKMVKFFDSPHVKYVQGKLTSINQASNEVSLECNEKSQTLPYDVLALCTGGQVGTIWRPAYDTNPTQEERKTEWSEMQAKVRESNDIMVVGGGPAGIESAGYLKEKYPGKNIGICLRGKTLLKDVLGAHEITEGILKQIGVELHYNTPFTEGQPVMMNGKEALTIDCSGLKFVGPKHFMTGDLAQCLDKRTGQILVNVNGQVTNVHPLTKKNQPSNPSTCKNIFSYGDVCLSPSNEVKSIVSMFQYGWVIAHNIHQVCCDQAGFVPIPEHMQFLQMIPIGSKNGVFAFNKMCKANKDAMAGKDNIRDENMGCLNCEAEWLKKSAQSGKKIGQIFGMATGCCVCLPMHMNKFKPIQEANKAKVVQAYDQLYS